MSDQSMHPITPGETGPAGPTDDETAEFIRRIEGHIQDRYPGDGPAPDDDQVVEVDGPTPRAADTLTEDEVAAAFDGAPPEDVEGEPGAQGSPVSPPQVPPSTPDAPAPTVDTAPSGEPAGGPADFTPPPEPSVTDPSPTDPTPTADTPTAPQDTPADLPDLNRVFDEYLGERPTVEQTVNLLGFIDQINQLPPDRQEMIGRILNGEDITPPAADPTPPPASSRRPPQRQDRGWDDWNDDDDVDPRVAEMQARLDEMQARFDDLSVAEQHRVQQMEIERQRAAHEQFISSHPDLSADDITLLAAKANRSGIYQAVYAQTGDAGRAWGAALEQTFTSDPLYRQRQIDAEAERRAQELIAQQQRQAVQSGLAPAAPPQSGPIASPAPAQTSPADRRAQLTAEAAAELRRSVAFDG